MILETRGSRESLRIQVGGRRAFVWDIRGYGEGNAGNRQPRR